MECADKQSEYQELQTLKQPSFWAHPWK